MEIIDGIYGLPQTLELDEMKEKIYPVAIEKDEGLILIDAGLPGNLETVKENLDEIGYSLEDVESLILTHQDFDHVGCAKKIIDETEATVYCHKKDAPAVDGKEEPIKGDERYPAVDVDVELNGGEVFNADSKKIEVIYTPGHTPGHVSLLIDEELLITGDALNVETSGLEGPRERFTPDMEEATESVHKLSFQEFEKVHCFHGGTVNEDQYTVKEVSNELGKQFDGFMQSSFEGPVQFLRKELHNEDLGLSVFNLEAGKSHGAKDNPEAGHRHSRQTEIYYFRKGNGNFDIGGQKVEYSEGDAFLVKAFKYRRIEAEKDTEFYVAGSPVNDKAEEGKLEK